MLTAKHKMGLLGKLLYFVKIKLLAPNRSLRTLNVSLNYTGTGIPNKNKRKKFKYSHLRTKSQVATSSLCIEL